MPDLSAFIIPSNSDMRFHLLISCFLVVMVVACGTEQSKPTYALTDDQLSNLLNDLYFSEALLISQTGEKRDSVRTLFWQRMTEVYQLDESALRAEVEKLKVDPEKLKMIFDRVKTEVDSLQ
jgi:hypothetical protein